MITPVIFSYCYPEHTDELYLKLKTDGFENVIVFDNGSPDHLKSSFTNLEVKENIMFGGAINYVTEYLLTHSVSDWYLFITTSAFLFNLINYKKNIEEAIIETSIIDTGIVASCVGDGNVPEMVYWLAYPELQSKYTIIGGFDQMFFVIKHDLLEHCFNKKVGSFSGQMKNGVANNIVLGIECFNLNKYIVVAQTLPIKWKKNAGYEKYENKQIDYRDRNINGGKYLVDIYGDWVSDSYGKYRESLSKLSNWPYDIKENSFWRLYKK
jgi:hypothetical protein